MHLRANPQIFKAGLGLRLDDLPDTYGFRNEVLAWERRFWRAPVARGLFLAHIDTTFALYRPGSSFSVNAVRTGFPYLARHEPWYINSANPTDEELYYRATAQRGNWSRSKLRKSLQLAIGSPTSEAILLHLGCGHERMPGWINLDSSPNVGADIVFNLEACSQQKLPLDESSVDGFFMCHVFEHIDNTLGMMEELYRVAKPGARFVIRLPHGASDAAWENPTHKRPYFPIALFTSRSRRIHAPITIIWQTGKSSASSSFSMLALKVPRARLMYSSTTLIRNGT
jgi:SAM-dependent methyltransferase